MAESTKRDNFTEISYSNDLSLKWLVVKNNKCLFEFLHITTNAVVGKVKNNEYLNKYATAVEIGCRCCNWCCVICYVKKLEMPFFCEKKQYTIYVYGIMVFFPKKMAFPTCIKKKKSVA